MSLLLRALRHQRPPIATPSCLRPPAARISCYSPTCARQTHFHSSTTPPHSARRVRQYKSALDSTTLLVAALVSIGIGYASYTYTATDHTEQPEPVTQEKLQVAADDWEKRYLIIDVMGPQPLPGRPGNLTAEQEQKLKEMWGQTLEFFGMSHEEVHRAQSNGNKQESTAETPEKKKRGLMGRLRGKDKTEKADADVGGVNNDKHGQVQEYEQALSSMKPEEIQEAFWNMSKHDHPDAILLRFLRARKWDVHAAQVMALSTLHWRLQEAHVDDDIMAKGEEGALKEADTSKESEDFIKQYRMGKSMLHGTDKDGRPCCYVRVRLHRQGEQCVESLERFTVHVIETARMLLRPPVDTATIVFDMTDFAMANMDYTPVKFMIKVFEANYPESLGSIIVYKSPWVFSQIWKIIRGWLDPVVASKVHFSSNVSELEEHIPRSQIIKELGGDLDWTYQYVEPKEGENKIMEDTATRDKLLAERKELTKQYETETLAWINGEDSKQKERDALAQKLAENYWTLDPYLRARSLYDRTGIIGPMGKLNFYPDENKEKDTPAAAAAANDDVD